MDLTNKQISEILIKGGYVSQEDISNTTEKIKRNKMSVIDYLISKEIISKDLFGQAVAEYFKVTYVDLNSNQPSREQVLKIPEEIAKKYRIVLFADDDKFVTITTDDPKQKGFEKELSNLFKNKKLVLTYSLSEDIDDILMYYKKTLETRFSEIIKSQKSVAPEIIDEIINDALTYRASDIHFEPQENEVVIRFRVDGVLQEAGRIPKENYENILNRIKIQSGIRIDEHFKSQDGAIRLVKDGTSVDMRVSTVPVLDGEKVVIRLLAEYVKVLNLSNLGLSEENQKIITESANSPFGMILTVGPTGSGKTTTLYSLLRIKNDSDVNITTIEDPVEFKIVGANQIQVNPEAGLTFAKGLRSILRQDPDVVLVGEIRDSETAEISVNAALTGHLLFSTFHANDSATTIPRLLDMGIEPFLLSSTLELIVAQRLVRKICEECRYSYVEDIKNIEKALPDAKKYFNTKKVTLYKGKGCPSCGGLEYKGRVGVFELLKVTPDLKDLILKNPSTQQIKDLAKKSGTKSLFEDGIKKVEAGITTLEELLRVTKP